MILNLDKNVVVSMIKVILKEKIGAANTNAQPMQMIRSRLATEALRIQEESTTTYRQNFIKSYWIESNTVVHFLLNKFQFLENTYIFNNTQCVPDHFLMNSQLNFRLLHCFVSTRIWTPYTKCERRVRAEGWFIHVSAPIMSISHALICVMWKKKYHACPANERQG